ncbi:tetratricopeptide (TPR) repeat protein [Catalinimonas alkaloidigena]|uniref:RagB/SusD family nutrient uptake outer membrane protein n=1 Tax=Catalinimonas alkaloidigena TaxID=1075417 RepID=UPI002406BA39|nr:RagB/SusD family nutrient uptake outer membrane protein [Catalinimonas alkaloidigena]MDF9797883.1 tetratricopeptide (TPR) repeat protein [Catalinimonas alkaloidigena]
MKNIISIISLSLVLVVISACKEDFLEQEYKNGLVDVNFFQKPEHAEKALTAVYDVLGFEGQYILTRMALGSSAADDIVELHGDFSRVGTGFIELDGYNWHSSSRYIMDHWYSSYKGIKRANDVIHNVMDIPGMDEVSAGRFVAEAKALRALFYYNLVTVFGDVPLLTASVSLEDSKNVSRDPASEVWRQIVTDLNEAKEILPASYDSADLGRVTTGFANALLSRVYLWTGEYEKAIAAAAAVTGYVLEPIYAQLFNGEAESGQESILEVMNASGSPSENIWRTEDSEVNRSIYTGPVFAWSHFMQPSRDFIDNAFEEGDVRRGDDVILDHREGDTYDINGDGVIDENDEIPANAPVDAHNLKYVKKGADLTSGGVWIGELQTVNVIIMRYAEVLLNKAEALNESGRSEEALAPLNQVRARAGLDPVSTTDQNQLRDIILHERAVEFCFEGHRFFDLKRTNKLDEVLGDLGFIAGKHEVFPIPQTEIDLTEISQNPGYN